jgi:hypothetical protein
MKRHGRSRLFEWLGDAGASLIFRGKFGQPEFQTVHRLAPKDAHIGCILDTAKNTMHTMHEQANPLGSCRMVNRSAEESRMM